MQAAGLLVIAHNSGGPRDDIIENFCNGLLAESVEGYSEAIRTVIEGYEGWEDVAENGKMMTERYSEKQFRRKVVEMCGDLL